MFIASSELCYSLEIQEALVIRGFDYSRFKIYQERKSHE